MEKQKTASPWQRFVATWRVVRAKIPYTLKCDYYDFSLVAVVIVLTCFGLIMLYSTTAYSAQMSQDNDMFYFAKQAKIDVACLVVALALSGFDYHLLFSLKLPAYLLAIGLMCLVHTGLGSTSHGATRWVNFGFVSFQPSETAKLAVILVASCMIIRFGKKVKELPYMAMLFGMGAVQSVVAWKVTDNLSAAIIIMSITIGMMFLAHPKTKPFLIMFAIMAVGAVGYVAMLANSGMEVTEKTPFRIRRILVWLEPERYANGYGYQTLQALYAIGSGGFFGRGLGNSIQKLGSIPEAQNDMIFSIICEELGVCGAILVLALFGYLLYRLFFIAQNAPDLFGSMLVSGVFIHIALQVILNVAVVLNVIPNTGVTLPFISYGGTSILFLMVEMSICLAVAKQIKIQGNLYQ